MVNSLRFKSTSPNKINKWSPDIGNEVQIRKKREREDNYVQEFTPEDRPVLLVKKKHAYPKFHHEQIFKGKMEADDYYRVTEESKVIDDVAVEVSANENQIRRKTFIHGSDLEENLKDSKDPDLAYKVEGIEFLPEGFIELDPLLYKDEFTFENAVDVEIFSEHQKKTVALRRKQYDQRNQKKKREVTLYVLDDKNSKIVDYLEKWYFKHKRRMNDDELGYAAELFQTDAKTMSSLQDAYLKRKKASNANDLKNYLENKGMLKDDQVNVPKSLKNYFVEKKQKKVKSGNKNGEKQDQSESYYLDKFKQKIVREKASNQQQSQHSIGGDKTILKRIGRSDQNPQKEEPSFVYDPVSQSFNLNANVPPVGYLQKRNNPTNDLNDNAVGYDKDNTLFYDEEVNKILDKIKGYRAVYRESNTNRTKNDSKPEIVDSRDKLFNDSLDLRGEMIIESFKQRVMDTFTDENLKDFDQNAEALNQISVIAGDNKAQYVAPIKIKDELLSKLISQDHKALTKRDASPDVKTKEVRKPSRQNHKQEDASTSLLKIDEKEIKAHYIQTAEDVKPKDRVVKKAHYIQTAEDVKPKDRVVKKAHNIQTAEDVKPKDRVVKKAPSMQHNPKNDHTLREKSKTEIKKDQEIPVKTESIVKVPNLVLVELPKRISIVARNVHGASIVTQKLRPVLFADNYYFQIVEELINEQGERKVTLRTNNQHGDLLEEIDVPESIIGQLYENRLIKREDPESKARLTSIEVLNERGETVAYHNIRSKVDSIWKDMDYDYIKATNPNMPADLKNKLSNRETPDLLAYKESVDKNDKRITCISELKDSESSIRVSRLVPILIGTEYFYQTVEERIFDKKKRKVTVRTYNDCGELISEIRANSQLMADSYYSKLKESAIEARNRNVTLETLNCKGKIMLSQDITPKQHEDLLNNYYNNIVEEIFDADNNRKISLVHRDKNNTHVILLTEIKPKETFDIEEVLDKENDERLRKATIARLVAKQSLNDNMKIFKSKKVSNRLKNKKSNMAKNKKSIIEVDNVTNLSTAGDQYYRGLVEDLFDDSSSIRSKSTINKRPTFVANAYYNDILIDAFSKGLKNYKQKLSETQTEGPTISIPKKSLTVVDEMNVNMSKNNEIGNNQSQNKDVLNKKEKKSKSKNKKTKKNESKVSNNKTAHLDESMDNKQSKDVTSNLISVEHTDIVNNEERNTQVNSKVKSENNCLSNIESVELRKQSEENVENNNLIDANESKSQNIAVNKKESHKVQQEKNKKKSKSPKKIQVANKTVIQKVNTNESLRNSLDNNAEETDNKQKQGVSEPQLIKTGKTNDIYKEKQDAMISSLPKTLKANNFNDTKNSTENKAERRKESEKRSDFFHKTEETRVLKATPINEKIKLVEKKAQVIQDSSYNNSNMNRPQYDIDITERKASPIKMMQVRQHGGELLAKIRSDINRVPERKVNQPMAKPKNFTDVRAKPYGGKSQNDLEDNIFGHDFDHHNNKSVHDNCKADGYAYMKRDKSGEKSGNTSYNDRNISREIQKKNRDDSSPRRETSQSKSRSQEKKNKNPVHTDKVDNLFKDSFMDKDVKINNNLINKNDRKSADFHRSEIEKRDRSNSPNPSHENDRSFGSKSKKKKSEQKDIIMKKPRTKSESKRKIESMKQIMTEELKQNKGKFNESMAKEMAKRIEGGFDEDLMNEFFDYCEQKLPNDFKYKDSVMFVTLFYYFLKREDLIK